MSKNADYVRNVGPRYQLDKTISNKKNIQTRAWINKQEKKFENEFISSRINAKFGEEIMSPDGDIYVDSSFSFEVGQNLPHVAIGWIIGSFIGLFIVGYFIVIPFLKLLFN